MAEGERKPSWFTEPNSFSLENKETGVVEFEIKGPAWVFMILTALVIYPIGTIVYWILT